MRTLGCSALLLATVTAALRSQAAPAPAPLNWSADDSTRVAFVTAHGRAYRAAHVTVWAPVDSLDAQWLPRFVDSLSASLATLDSLIERALENNRDVAVAGARLREARARRDLADANRALVEIKQRRIRGAKVLRVP